MLTFLGARQRFCDGLGAVPLDQSGKRRLVALSEKALQELAIALVVGRRGAGPLLRPSCTILVGQVTPS